jgi:hypothetical protein
MITAAFSGVIERSYSFNPPIVTDNAGAWSVEMENCHVTGEPGEPALPVYGVSFLLPPGESISSVEVINGDRIVVGDGIQISPIQTPLPISERKEFIPTPPNPGIYNSNNPFPQQLYGQVSTQYLCGYSVGYLLVYPVQYRPETGELSYYSDITIVVTTAPSSEAAAALRTTYRGFVEDRNRLANIVDNISDAVSYGNIDGPTDIETYPYLIITTAELASSMEPFIDFKNRHGLFTEVVTMTEIEGSYPGIDTQDKVRSCIMTYFQLHGTRYVLLVGDDEQIPHRGMYGRVGDEIDDDIAADLYYACLNGTWDTNNNGVYGEYGEEDFLHEVYLGRACVDSPDEAANFVDKNLSYQTAPVGIENETALMVGEDLGWVTWGSDLKEQVRVGSAYNPPIPTNFNTNTLYDTQTWEFSAVGDLLPLLNGGVHLVNHMGHCNVTYMMKFSHNGVNSSSMTNNGVNHNYYIIYSQGCYCGAFDNRGSSGGPGNNDCISEKFCTINTGAVAMVTNSRYGWGDYYGLDGPSQWYDREFFDALFDEGITQIGAVNQDSKEDNINNIGTATRWCYYQLNLFGDPSLDIWTDEPSTINANYNPSILFGSQSYTVEFPGVEGAYCALTSNSGLIASAYTNSAGTATFTFDPPIASVDTLSLSITAHNYYPFSDRVMVITPNNPYMTVPGVSVNDAVLGDNDGELDLGESSMLSVDFRNIGLVSATGVYAKLFCSDEMITITDDSVWLGDIGAETLIQSSEAFQITASSDVIDNYQADFVIKTYDSLDSTWTMNFNLILSAPTAIITSVEAFDGGDNILSAGETADIQITLSNIGSGEVRNATAALTSDSPYIIMNSMNSGIAFLGSNGAGQLSPMFNLTISDTCPNGLVLPMYLEMTDGMGYYRELILEIFVGGFADNMESGAGDWTHEVVTTSFADQWHQSVLRNNTFGGTTSWHFGAIDGSGYSNLADGGLITPTMTLSEDVYLTFYHWMEAETSSVSQGYAYDGGIVEMSYGGSPFFQINPVGMYPYYIREGSVPGPFRVSLPVFSGSHDWQYVEFNLSQYQVADVRFRFRFGSDGSDNAEGWYIDDVKLVYVAPVQPPTNFSAAIEDNLVTLNWNSPGAMDNLLYYNIYRDGSLIATEIQRLEYIDDLDGLSFGDYSYQMSAVYSQNESNLTDPQVVTYDGSAVTGRDELIPIEFYLDKNFPNPFNPETSFRFGLPKSGMVTLKVYNIAGQEVARLVDGNFNAGNHTVTWQAQNHTSGVYIYEMRAEGFHALGKMLLLK